MTKEAAKNKAIKYLLWADLAEKKSKQIYDSFNANFKDFDWTQPILLGHHSQRRHEKVYERRNSVMSRIRELDARAKRFREKAVNLNYFANTNKGDAEARRIEKRKTVDSLFSVGSEIYDVCYRSGVILKVNTKTFTIRFASGFTTTRDKSYFYN